MIHKRQPQLLLRNHFCTHNCTNHDQRASCRQTLPWDYFTLARDPSATGGECSDRLLHCEDGAEPGRSLDNALISLRSFGQRVGLDYRFNFSLG